MPDQLSVLPGQVVTLVNAGGSGTTGAWVSVARYSGSTMPANFAWQITLNGSPSALNVSLEGSLDGTTAVALDTYSTAANALRHVSGKPVAFIRGKVTSVTGGTITLTLMPA
jgi:hypothetical protein